ncbi:hypothetical protein GCM10011512_03560 [Tersicoccus solisilvae]|uniref:Uncharacterized protein n=1 Tax=Tersicoccus solisilvae TaxID=1882339 RepID=A0ABQ1NLL1_9MICC|nr:hypothetical protein GCM10011512_03560 [Tersicoccus solisilvae]
MAAARPLHWSPNSRVSVWDGVRLVAAAALEPEQAGQCLGLSTGARTSGFLFGAGCGWSRPLHWSPNSRVIVWV